MKKILCVLVLIGIVFAFAGCVETKSLHCDRCGKTVYVEQTSNMEEDWSILCGECNEDVFGDDPFFSGK